MQPILRVLPLAVLCSGAVAQGGFEPPALQTALNSSSIDTEPSLSFDGLTVYYYSNRAGGVGGLDLYSSTRAYPGAPWSAPVLDASLSSVSSDSGPFLALGDLEIHFSSNRVGSTPIAGSTSPSVDIWRATRTAPGQPWSTPVNVAELNSPGGETQFSMTHDGLECFFLTTGWGNPTTGNNSIYRSTRTAAGLPWSTPTIVTELFNGNTHRDVEISGDGLQIVYTEFKPSPISRLWVIAASRPDRNSPFGAPVNWSEFNAVGTLQGVNSFSLSWNGDEAIMGVGFATTAGNQELMRARRSIRYGQGCGGVAPLDLGANAPSVGGAWDLTTSAIDPLSPISITFFGGAPGAVELGFLGAPSCFANIDQLFGSQSATAVAGTSLVSIGVPVAPALVGSVFFTQSVCLAAGNALGLYTSNGVKSVVGG